MTNPLSPMFSMSPLSPLAHPPALELVLLLLFFFRKKKVNEDIVLLLNLSLSRDNIKEAWSKEN